MRILFMGTPELACASLEALLAAPGVEIVAVVTQPDRPSGRKLKLTPSPVKELALRSGLPVLQPERAREEGFIRSLGTLQPDLIAVAAYGQILPKAILDVPRFGCVNVHTSLLPKYRGAAPIQWAILNGDAETGVTIMKMDAGLDTGAILAQECTKIEPNEDALSLHHRLARLGAGLLVKTIPPYTSGKLQPSPQPAEGASYARKITKEDGRIDWNRDARAIHNQVRGLVPWPGAFTKFGTPQPSVLKIWQTEVIAGSGVPGHIRSANKDGIVVSCGQDALRILLLQREGARRLTPQQFLAGWPLKEGQPLN